VSKRAAPQQPDVTSTSPRLDGTLARWLSPTSESRVERIACSHVHDRPWWAQDPISEQDRAALRDSVATRGIIEPLLLRHRAEGGLEVVTGSRRLQVARELEMARVPAIVRELADREAILVAAWSTVERRHPSTDELVAVNQMLIEAGLTPDEARVLAGSRPPEPATETVLGSSALTAPFLLRPLVRSYRSATSFAPFLRVSVGAVPDMTPAQRAAALAVLDSARPASIAT